MILIGDKLLSEDIFEKQFACDISACKGACCVEGEGGAPLTEEECAILDEVFDASLDSNGCDEFLKLLNELGKETNVFVISHKGDVLQDKFRSVIKFEKHKNFSRIAA